MSNSPVFIPFRSCVTLEQGETSSELNGVVVLNILKSSVIEVQWSSSHAALSEILSGVRDVGLIDSLHPSVVELHVFIIPEVVLLVYSEAV